MADPVPDGPRLLLSIREGDVFYINTLPAEVFEAQMHQGVLLCARPGDDCWLPVQALGNLRAGVTVVHNTNPPEESDVPESSG